MTLLLKLIFPLVGWGQFSILMCSVSLSLGPPQSGIVTVGAAISIGKEVVKMDELGNARGGAFDLLAGGALGSAANFCAALGTERSFGTARCHIQLVVRD